VCVAEMAMGNRIGARIDVAKIPGDGRLDVLLFAETVTRWIVSVPKRNKEYFERILSSAQTPFACIGETKKEDVQFEMNGSLLIDEKIQNLYDHWTKGVSSLMG
jgi:phosphoribosylformylglycinamidine synthase